MRLLSYALTGDTPMFPGNASPGIQQESSIASGDVANTMLLQFLNHSGTHVDLPRHFWDDGPTVTDVEADRFVFDSAVLIDMPKSDGDLITADDLYDVFDEFSPADLLIIRTGFAEKHRDTDPQRYVEFSPGFHRDAALVLLDARSSLRAIVIDTISAACPRQLCDGIEFHRRVLGATGLPRQLMIIEDAYLPGDISSDTLGRVVIAPLLIENADGAPCTILAGL